MTTVVRRANAADAEALSSLNADVQALHATALPSRFKPVSAKTFPPAEVAALLARPDALAFLAEVDCVPAGYLYAEIVRRPETPFSYAYEMVYLHHISVRPGYRRKGVGHALLSALRATADDLRITLIGLDVWSFNEEARIFFRREGFTPYIERLWSGRD
jgi:GNAT superfamily N-acetyltransferase